MKIRMNRWGFAGMLVGGILAGFGPRLWSDPAATMAASAPAVHTARVRLVVGQEAPELAATDLLTGKDVSIKDFRGKPLVLQFASITEPIFRMHSEASEKLAADFGDKVAFVIVYQREAHAADSNSALEENQQEGFSFAQPLSLDERVKLARQCAERLKITQERMLVDAWNDATSGRYGGLENMTFLIDGEGHVAAGYPWMDTHKMQGAINAVLAGKPVPAQYAGPTRATTIPAADLEGSAGVGGPLAGLVSALDQMKLTAAQKQGIIPPLTNYIAALREFRETRQPTTDKAAAATPEEVQNKVQAIRADGDKLRAAFKEFLSADDAKTMTDALDRAFGGGRGPRTQ